MRTRTLMVSHMPIDLRMDAGLGHCVVVDRLGNTLPFSKGILATSILATGIETPRAYEVARTIQDRLVREQTDRIDSDALTLVTAQQIEQLVSKEIADSYMLWRKARRIGRPIIISTLGSSGVGKSTLATRLALRLGINRVVTTDAIREVLRTVIPASVLPELHVSSYEAIESDPSIELSIDVDKLRVSSTSGLDFPVTMPDSARDAPISGRWDPIQELIDNDALLDYFQ